MRLRERRFHAGCAGPGLRSRGREPALRAAPRNREGDEKAPPVAGSQGNGSLHFRSGGPVLPFPAPFEEMDGTRRIGRLARPGRVDVRELRKRDPDVSFGEGPAASRPPVRGGRRPFFGCARFLLRRLVPERAAVGRSLVHGRPRPSPSGAEPPLSPVRPPILREVAAARIAARGRDRTAETPRLLRDPPRHCDGRQRLFRPAGSDGGRKGNPGPVSQTDPSQSAPLEDGLDPGRSFRLPEQRGTAVLAGLHGTRSRHDPRGRPVVS